jgi:hypothetical protein
MPSKKIDWKKSSDYFSPITYSTVKQKHPTVFQPLGVFYFYKKEI